MNAVRFVFALGLAAGLVACTNVDTATRNAPPSPASPVGASPGQPSPVAPTYAQYSVADIRISVPRDLKVSEANKFYPIADIVWRGEPLGDRHAQVAAIFEDGFAAGTAQMRGGRPVIVEATITRFHCLTEKTRYTVGGVHSIHFDLTIRDAATGAIIDGPRKVVADTKASGGARAIAEDEAGRTQRVVIVERLAQVIARELGNVPLASAGAPSTRMDGDLRLIPAVAER